MNRHNFIKIIFYSFAARAFSLRMFADNHDVAAKRFFTLGRDHTLLSIPSFRTNKFGLKYIYFYLSGAADQISFDYIRFIRANKLQILYLKNLIFIINNNAKIRFDECRDCNYPVFGLSVFDSNFVEKIKQDLQIVENND